MDVLFIAGATFEGTLLYQVFLFSLLAYSLSLSLSLSLSQLSHIISGHTQLKPFTCLL